MQEDKSPKKRIKKGTGWFLHLLQHGFFVGMVVLATIVVMGSFVMLETREGMKMYRISSEEVGTLFEESRLFNQLLGQNVSDIICYGAIRGQMETDGKFNPKKVVDATAFANRYEGLQDEYITASYYLEDLIKWAQYGFAYEEVYLSGEEVDNFLSRKRTVTTVDLSSENYSGGTVSYLNSDTKSFTKIIDVSGNILVEGDGEIRDATDATLLNNRYHTVEGKNIENYVSSWDEYYDLCDHVVNAANDLNINYEEYLKLNEYYEKENSNIIYYIRRTIGNDIEVFSNQTVKSEKFSALEANIKENCNKYIIYDPANMKYETNTLIEESTLRYILNGYEYAYPENTQILIGVKETYSVGDAFKQARLGYNSYSPYFWQYLLGAIFCGVMYLFLLVILTMKEGKIKGNENAGYMICLKREDRIPTEVMGILAIVAGFAFIFLTEILLNFWQTGDMAYKEKIPVLSGVFSLVLSIAFSFFYYSFARRIKAKTLWKNSLGKRLADCIKKWALFLYDNASVVLRVWIPFGGFVLLHLLLCFGIIDSGNGFITVLLFVVLLAVDVIVGVMLYKSAQARQRILEGIKRINDGDMEHKIMEENLHGDNLVLARAVNNIGEGIRNAVATSMKDERLKADLITNVSHDIKTPLTSIINYVDLIKRENIDHPKVREYITVLDAKSQRLKQLTDDLVEASKISSGNIVLQWEKINLVELLNQTIGEFSEKFEEKALTPVLRSGKSNVFIEADSRRIWRVIENLFNNIFKYALSGTRVYIDLEERETEKGLWQVALSIRNISANPIKVNADELTERFIRGDESRTTEGSGLGLSIAKNLTEVQKGKFEIIVDGDLFKVVLTFPLLEQN